MLQVCPSPSHLLCPPSTSPSIPTQPMNLSSKMCAGFLQESSHFLSHQMEGSSLWCHWEERVRGTNKWFGFVCLREQWKQIVREWLKSAMLWLLVDLSRSLRGTGCAAPLSTSSTSRPRPPSPSSWVSPTGRVPKTTQCLSPPPTPSQRGSSTTHFVYWREGSSVRGMGSWRWMATAPCLHWPTDRRTPAGTTPHCGRERRGTVGTQELPSPLPI